MNATQSYDAGYRHGFAGISRAMMPDTAIRHWYSAGYSAGYAARFAR